MVRVQMLLMLNSLVDKRPLSSQKSNTVPSRTSFYPFTRFYLHGAFIKNIKHRVKKQNKKNKTKRSLNY